jgi:hypothetical protein
MNGMLTTPDDDPNRLAAPADITAEAVTAIPILMMGRLRRPFLICRTSIPIS